METCRTIANPNRFGIINNYKAVFASLIPEITDLVGRPNVYAGCYQINPVKKYVLLARRFVRCC